MKKICFSMTIFLFSTILFAQEQKDTLFFDYNKEYFYVKENDPRILFINVSKGNDEMSIAFFIENRYINLNSKKTLDLKKFIRNTKYYNKKSNEISDYFGLYSFMNQYHLFLVILEKDSSRKYIEVSLGVSII